MSTVKVILYATAIGVVLALSASIVVKGLDIVKEAARTVQQDRLLAQQDKAYNQGYLLGQYNKCMDKETSDNAAMLYMSYAVDEPSLAPFYKNGWSEAKLVECDQ